MAKKSTPYRKYTPVFKVGVLRLVANGESILGVAQKMGFRTSIEAPTNWDQFSRVKLIAAPSAAGLASINLR
jgi:hypothetical protein